MGGHLPRAGARAPARPQPRDLGEEGPGERAAERFDYLYSGAELEEIAQPVRLLASRARRTHVLFNNCHGDKAQRNAAQFRRLLG
jgi:uncharacterized protein YecE (DUF72 family)